MEMTTGWILVALSAAGIIGSVSGLIATRKVFAKQRKNLLEKIETE